MKKLATRLSVLLLTIYWAAYLSLRLSGSIVGHVAQGHFELEPDEAGLIRLVPRTLQSCVWAAFQVPMWLETPLLKFYVPEPGGG